MKNILILGGDLRLVVALNEFIKDGFEVGVYGTNEKYIGCPCNTYNDIITAISESDIIIMGLPMSKDSVTVSAPFCDETIYINDIIKHSDSKKIFFGGMISEDVLKKFESASLFIYDYYKREELIIKNVVPTVEGAISLAIEETPFTLHGARCLVCGFGRIGKYLSYSLKALGANVTVSARKNKDLAWCECFSYDNIRTNEIAEHINKYDIIFNTIPYNVLDKSCIDNMKKGGIIIDLASKPGGLDFNYAKEKGIKAVWALSLPGKTAPLTAGKIIKNTITNILTELGGQK